MYISHGGDIYDENGKAMEILDFSASINPLGMPSAARRALVENAENYDSYPDPKCRELRQALAKRHCLRAENIVCGNGAADIIYRLILSQKPKRALIIAPTFGEYERALRLYDCVVENFLLAESNQFVITQDILSHITSLLDMLVLCSPNNPTGLPIERELLIKIAEKCAENGVLLMVDECFNEFLERPEDYSFVGFLKFFKCAVVLKAFTKSYAMAGLRLGYALSANREIIDGIDGALQSWSVSTPAEKCGVAALGEVDFLQKTRSLIAKERNFLAAGLAALGVVIFPSKANFLLFKTDDFALAEKLFDRNVLIRSCADFVGLGEGFYRIAVRTRAENARLLAEIAAVGVGKNG